MRRVLIASLTVLALAACGGTNVGLPCTTDDDCARGLTCYTNLPGGYCTKGCSISGQRDECPGGSVCSPHSSQLLCAQECQTKADCRAEYECNGLTGSDVKSCRPKI